MQHTLESQLGFYVGEYIYFRYLPTLSTDSLQSRKVIKVSDEDTVENQRLESEWIKSTKRDRSSDGVTEEWKAYLAHNRMLGEKYLPHYLKCHVPQVHIENIEEFKKGLINSLWNTDLCAYSLKPENIEIKNDDYFTCIELALGTIVFDF
jgi:hypothetical protein